MEGRDSYQIGVRVMAAIMLEAASLTSDEQVHDRQRQLLKSLLDQAERIRLMPGMGIAGNIASLIKFVDETLPHEADPKLGRCLQELRDALAERGQHDHCALCAKLPPDRPLCAELGNLDPADSPKVCLDELACLMFAIKDKSCTIYSRYCKRAQTTPVKFAIQLVKQGQSLGFIPEFHLDTDTQVDEGGSMVNINLEDKALDLQTLFQVAYACAHELICHAYQGIHGEDRADVDPTCSWSEGWMDAVAWRLLEHWLNVEQDSLPAWLTAGPARVIRDCRRLHDRRYRDGQGRMMTPFNLHRRAQARDACDELYRQWSSPRDPSRSALRKLLQFSVGLNVVDVKGKWREALVVALGGGLLANTPHMLSRTVRACDAFLRDGEHEKLLEELQSAGEYVYPRVPA